MSFRALPAALICALALAACAQVAPRPVFNPQAAGPGDSVAGGFILRKTPSGGLAFRDLVCREEAFKKIFVCVRADREKPLRYWVMASAFNGKALYVRDGRPVLSIAQAFDTDCAAGTSSGAETLSYDGYFGLGRAQNESDLPLPVQAGDAQKMLARALCEKIAQNSTSGPKK